MIVGGPSTGKTNILKLIATPFSGMTMLIVDSRSRELNDLEGQSLRYIHGDRERQLDDFYQALYLYNEVEKRQRALDSSSGLPITPNNNPGLACISRNTCTVSINGVNALTYRHIHPNNSNHKSYNGTKHGKA